MTLTWGHVDSLVWLFSAFVGFSVLSQNLSWGLLCWRGYMDKAATTIIMVGVYKLNDGSFDLCHYVLAHLLLCYHCMLVGNDFTASYPPRLNRQPSNNRPTETQCWVLHKVLFWCHMTWISSRVYIGLLLCCTPAHIIHDSSILQVHLPLLR